LVSSGGSGVGQVTPLPLLPNPPAPDTFDLATAVAGKLPSVDTNKDGIPDGIDVDTDGDGTPDATAVDSDGDQTFDLLKRDLDRDGLFEAVVETAGPPAPVGEPTACKAEFTMPTAQYVPKYNANSGAIWVTDEAGTYIRTLKAWSARREKHVQKWVAASKGDRENAISSASLGKDMFITHTVTWDCTDNLGMVLPFGKYTLHAEFTQTNGAGPYLPVTFERGATPVEASAPPAEKGYPMGVTVKYTPQP
jgi:hypothetical protein